MNNYERFERFFGGRGEEQWQGRGGDETTDALVPVVETPPVDAVAAAEATSGVARAGSAALALLRVIVDAGPVAVGKLVEFCAGRIANERTRAAYARAVGQFLGWCEARGLRLAAVSPLHVAAYILDARAGAATAASGGRLHGLPCGALPGAGEATRHRAPSVADYLLDKSSPQAVREHLAQRVPRVELGVSAADQAAGAMWKPSATAFSRTRSSRDSRPTSVTKRRASNTVDR